MRALLPLLLACADDPTPPAPPTTIDWATCGRLSGQTGPAYDCAHVTVPLRWDDPDGATTTVFVKRRRAANPAGRGLWLFPGGPGFSGLNMEPHAERIAAADDTLDLYMLDHRGTGWSTPLLCPVENDPDSPGGVSLTLDEYPPCKSWFADTWGHALDAFSTTTTARDLGFLIDLVGDDHAYVLGVSYGTWLVHRYLQLFPDQADAVVMDSNCAPGACTLSDQDIWEDPVVSAWLTTTCAADPDCAARLPDPVGALEDVHAALETGHCGVLGATAAERRGNLRAGLSYLFLFADFRAVLPAFLHRVQRCDDDDADAIYQLYDVLFGGAAAVPPPADGERAMYNELLAMHVLKSELWDDAATPEALTARYQASLVGRGVSQFMGVVTDGWAGYDEPLKGAFAATDTPMLMLAARHDNLTPLDVAQAPLRDAFTGPNQHFVVVDNASHDVLSQSRRASDPNRACGLDLAVSFLRDPTSALDRACLDDLYDVGLQPAPAFVDAVFGTPSLWGGEAVRHGAPHEPVAPVHRPERLGQALAP